MRFVVQNPQNKKMKLSLWIYQEAERRANNNGPINLTYSATNDSSELMRLHANAITTGDHHDFPLSIAPVMECPCAQKR
jgi:hypothetical protein